MNAKTVTAEMSILALGRVPREPFLTIWAGLMEDRGFDVSKGRKPQRFKPRTEPSQVEFNPPTISVLGDLIGIPAKTLLRMFHGEQTSFSFDICDKILCELADGSRWLYDDLAHVYNSINLSYLAKEA